jgi:endonuclease YncB( thermonuclease family)
MVGREMKPKRIAKRATASVAETLGIGPVDPDAGITFEPGQTERIVLVYQVDAADRTPALAFDDAVLPITNVTKASTSPFALMPSVAPALPEPATLLRVVDGNTVKVRVDGTGEEAFVELIGVDAPVEDECYAAKAKTRLKKLVGESLLLEADPSVVENERPRRYVWSVGDDGNPVLINHAMVAAGNAYAAQQDLSGRFGVWINGAAEDAESKSTGIWKTCDEPAATAPGADSQPGTREPAPTPQVVTQWAGEINLFGTIEFTIADTNLTYLRLDLNIPCSVPGSTTRITTTSNAVIPVESGTFEDEVRINQFAAGSLTGTLMSESLAVGTITLPPLDGCTTVEIQQRWTAEPE